MEQIITSQYPWDRYPNEGETAWACFQDYLHMPYPRKVSAIANPDVKGRSLDSVKRMSSEFSWRKRTALYDSYFSNKTSDEEAKELAIYRSQVSKHEVDDYEAMLDAWRTKFEAAVLDGAGVEELGKLIRAREQIDQFGRRAVRMPSHYSAKEQEEEPETVDEWMVSFEGSQRLPAEVKT